MPPRSGKGDGSKMEFKSSFKLADICRKNKAFEVALQVINTLSKWGQIQNIF